jgi:hypothetical protein
MSAQQRGETIVKSLMSSDARNTWNKDPIAYLEANGISLANATAEHQDQLRTYVQSLPLPPAGSRPGTAMVDDSAGDWFACTGCKVGIGATVTGIAAVIVAAIVAAGVVTGGAAAPEEAAAAGALETGTAVAEVATVAAETSLPTATVVRIFAAAWVAGGAAEFLANAVDGLCQATGACS